MTRVLVVDDKEENRYYLQALLSASGYEVDIARHGAEALTIARQRLPAVVISDLLMPVMDGYTLLRRWKSDARLSAVPFIVYTATYTEPSDEQLALDLGADSFLLKPAEPDEFLRVVRNAESRRATEPPIGATAPDDDPALLNTYSDTLIRKLEEKMLQLEEANEALQSDIAQRRKVEEALRTSESETRLLIESIPQIVWVTGPDGAHTDFNHRWFEFTGRSLVESLGDGWLPAFHPDDRPRAAARWQEAVDTGELYEIEYRLRRADGSYHWMLGRALPVRGPDARIVRWFGTCTDIQAMKEAEERIAEQARLLDQTQDAIVVHDLDHRVLYWNEGAEQVHGWNAGEAIGREVTELHGPRREHLDDITIQLLSTGEWRGDLDLVDRQGRPVLAEGRWTLLRDPAGQPRSILAVNTDVTERRRIEAQFLRAQRMESIGTLAGGIAHDLNNLLSPILLGVALLRDSDLGTDDLETLATMEASARRGAELIGRVLSFARGVEGARVAVDVDEVVDEVVSILSSGLPPDASLESHVSDDLWTAIGDPTQLHQVLLNLALNARDAIHEGGTVTIRARNEAADLLPADVRARVGVTPCVVISVSDDGDGVPSELGDRIFEPFVTTKPVGDGTGLGLATVLGIVTSHGGHVEVESRPGSGSTFSVWLPAGGVSATGQAGATVRLLVVDDDPLVLASTTRILTGAGYEVTAAIDGAEALEQLRSTAHELLVTDVMMPGIDGPTLAERAREITPGIPVIATSGIAVPGDALTAGHFDHFIPQPFDPTDLLSTVRKALSEPSRHREIS